MSRIFQCSNGHLLCKDCHGNPQLKKCPICRVMIRGQRVRGRGIVGGAIRNIFAETVIKSLYETCPNEGCDFRVSYGG